jgi:hypothetical protein
MTQAQRVVVCLHRLRSPRDMNDIRHTRLAIRICQMLADENPGTGCAILAQSYALSVEQQPGSTEDHLARMMTVSCRRMPEVFRIARPERERSTS